MAVRMLRWHCATASGLAATAKRLRDHSVPGVASAWREAYTDAQKAAIMSEFKFNCSGCGQHILANEEWGGRQINCPSCNTRITVPPPAKELKKNVSVVPAAKRERPKTRGGTPQTDKPAKRPGAATATAPALPATAAEGKVAKTSAAKEPERNAPVMPPTQGVRPMLPSDLQQSTIPAKEAGTVKAPTPAASAPEREGEVGKKSPAERPKLDAPPALPPKSLEPKIPGETLRVELPVARTDAGKTPAKPSATSQQEAQNETTAPTAPQTKPEAATDAPQPPEQLRVAVLSPAVKRDIVCAVRHRIAEESAWLPGKVKGAIAYAAKMQNEEVVLLDAKSPEATRFSLIGAILREMEARRVATTATGRRRFLDEEIPDTTREVLLEHVSEEEREGNEDPLAGRDLLSITHAQCLAVLDALAARYSHRVEELQIEKAKRRLGNVRLPDLVKKLEKKVPISPEEVATALYHELMEARRRLERLESRSGPPN